MVLKRRLAALPEIEALKRLSQSLAMLDAVMTPVRESRYYSFNSRWAEGEMVASMFNGSGDEYAILFNPHGAIIIGLAHESPMSPYGAEPGGPWPGVSDDVPAEFQAFLSEPAFFPEGSTFCIWRKYSDSSWQVGRIDYPAGDDPDGSEDLLHILDGRPHTYQQFAEEYYERRIELSAVEDVYRHKPLTGEIIERLNADRTKLELWADAEEIGYPVGS